MNCKKLTDLLSEYVDGSLEKEIANHLEQHLHDCPDCDVFLKEFKTTIDWTCECMQGEAKMPPELESRMTTFIAKLEAGELDNRETLEIEIHSETFKSKKAKLKELDTSMLGRDDLDFDGHSKNCKQP